MSEGVSIHMTSLEEQLTRSIRAPLAILFAAVVLLLLVACANVANLWLIRSLARESEMAVRAALGASRADLIRKVLIEAMVFGLVGGGVGILLAHGGIRLLRGLAPDGLALMRVIEIDGTVLAFTTGISVLSALLVGLIPALKAGRVDLVHGLKGSKSKSGGRGWLVGMGLRRWLAVMETAFAVILLIGASLLVRSFVAMTAVDNGYRPTDVLTAELVLPESKYPDLVAQQSLYDRLLEAMVAVPSVESAGLINWLPISGSRAIIGLAVEGRPPVTDRSQMPRASFRVASEGYFTAMGIPLVRGRSFASYDRAGSPRVVLINESLARRYFPDEDPIGRKLARIGEIAGIVGDVRQDGVDSEPEPEVFMHYRQADPVMPMIGGMSLALRHSPGAIGMAGSLRGVLAELDQDLPLANVRPMTDRLAVSMARPRLYAWLLGVFGALAFSMACIGVYGVVSYSVDQRRRETGIRMALGASGSDVRAMVLREGVLLTVIGVGMGVAVALVTTRALSQLLFEVDPLDPGAFVGSSIAIVAAIFAASLIPASRAATTDVVHALRHE